MNLPLQHERALTEQEFLTSFTPVHRKVSVACEKFLGKGAKDDDTACQECLKLIAPEVQKDLKKREEPFYSCDVVVKEECSDDNYWWEDDSEKNDTPENKLSSKRKRSQPQKDSETNARKKIKQDISDVKEELNSNNVEKKKFSRIFIEKVLFGIIYRQ